MKPRTTAEDDGLLLGRYEVTKPDSKFDTIHDEFKGHEKVIKLKPGGWTFQPGFVKHAAQYAKFQYFSDDVVVQTFPKSGTTWTQEVVWTMRNNPDLRPTSLPLHLRVPNIEVDCQIEQVPLQEKLQYFETMRQLYPSYDPGTTEPVALPGCAALPRPRTFKYHLPLELSSPSLLDTAKVVYVIRDPRDVCLSYLHHCRLFKYESFTGTQDQFVDAFLNDQVIFGPYWAHVAGAWAQRDHPNMLVLFYEKMTSNPTKEYRKLAAFLGVDLTEEQLKNIVEHTSFLSMQRRQQHSISAVEEPQFLHMEVQDSQGGFFRKGQSGGWQEALTEPQKQKFAKWIQENCPDQAIMDSILHP